MKKNILTLALVASILFGIFACQVYDQSTNGVVYTAMPTTGAVLREDLVARLEKIDLTSDLIVVGKEYKASYTGLKVDEAGDEIAGSYRTAVQMKADILELWDLKYPAEWTFTR